MKDLNMNGSATFYFKNEIPYATIPKEYLQEKALSLEAKGLLTIIYTMPEKWSYCMQGLCNITGKSLKTIRRIIKELEEFEYIVRKRKQDQKGKFYYEYFIEISRKEYRFNQKENEWEYPPYYL